MLGSPPVNNIVIDADRHWIHGDFLAHVTEDGNTPQGIYLKRNS